MLFLCPSFSLLRDGVLFPRLIKKTSIGWVSRDNCGELYQSQFTSDMLRIKPWESNHSHKRIAPLVAAQMHYLVEHSVKFHCLLGEPDSVESLHTDPASNMGNKDIRKVSQLPPLPVLARNSV
jgi:hypothetical protein